MLRKEEIDTVSWQQIDWEKRCGRSNHLLDDDYEDLALTLDDFAPFDGIDLTGEKLRKQAIALMAGLRAIAGEITSEMAPTSLKSDEFSVSANILILSALVRIFAITPELEGDIYRKTDFQSHAAELSPVTSV
ncbi:hypothetical protein EMCG_06225 [[Emmonsia] crescens]|uniref:Uncharacterized protein n=1 Tax=[Emmonsia] crescens TaxID=73230 RepID=A0A0G2ICV3_9EURO|nr:hypothetical protein EMCG_06225 [Emmonsia crescens UAMH 3008]